MTKYLLDANVFIEAKNRYYGFDFCPAFWDWLDQENGAGFVFSIEKVGDELAAGQDDLSVWAAQRGAAFFLPPDAAMIASFGTLSQWVNGYGYAPAAATEFLRGADYYLVSYAHAHGFVVVTHEVPSNGLKRVKIPTACIAVGVKCISPFEMLRDEHARFVL